MKMAIFDWSGKRFLSVDRRRWPDEQLMCCYHVCIIEVDIIDAISVQINQVYKLAIAIACFWQMSPIRCCKSLSLENSRLYVLLECDYDAQ